MKRRGLFAALLAAPVLALAARPVVAVPVLEPAPKRTEDQVWHMRDNLIRDALTLLGVIVPGEVPDSETFLFCLRIGLQQKPETAHEFAKLLAPAYPPRRRPIDWNKIQFIPESQFTLKPTGNISARFPA